MAYCLEKLLSFSDLDIDYVTAGTLVSIRGLLPPLSFPPLLIVLMWFPWLLLLDILRANPSKAPQIIKQMSQCLVLSEVRGLDILGDLLGDWKKMT